MLDAYPEAMTAGAVPILAMWPTSTLATPDRRPLALAATSDRVKGGRSRALAAR